MKQTELLFKTVFVGDVGAGKTTAVKALSKGVAYEEKYTKTEGVDFGFLTQTEGNQTIRLTLWDIGGNERFGNMLRVYFNEARIFSIFVDINKKFENQMIEITKWLGQIQSKVPTPVEFIIVLSKADKDRGVNVDEVKSRVDKWILETYPPSSDLAYAGSTAISIKDNNFETLRNLLFDTAKKIAAKVKIDEIQSLIEKKQFPEKYEEIVADKAELQDKLIALFEDYTSLGFHWRHNKEDAKKLVTELKARDFDANEWLEKLREKYQIMTKLTLLDPKGTFAETLLYAIKLIDESQHQAPSPGR